MSRVMSAIDDERVYQVWHWCQDSYANVGHRLQFPNATDPQKTYPWRYAKRLAKQLDEWDFNDTTCKVFIEHVASYAKEKRLLHKGMSAFFQSNILQVCYDRLEVSHQRSETVFVRLNRTKSFLDRNSISDSILKGLIDRRSPDAFFNIVTWFDCGEISKLYLALSKSCTVALARINKIDPDQRSMLPSRSELFIIGQDFLANAKNKAKAKKLLDSDWR